MNQTLHESKILKKLWEETKKTWHIALPAILASVTQFSMEFVTSAFVGHLGQIELAALSEVQNVVEGFVFGVMLGMGSALETLCGQAVGAGQFNMLGIYLQRSLIITGVTALLLTPVYVFTSPILQFLRQDKEISQLAGKYTLWVIPRLFAYALNFPMQKFLQSQSRVWFMTIASIVTLALHVPLNWILVIKLDQGLLGAALAGNISWWILIIAQMLYIISGRFKDAWTGFSWLAFKSLTSFVKLSIASAIMLCLELWYFTAVILMVGGLKDAAIAVDAISICMGLQLWAMMVGLGFNASVSVRVSNELGAGKPKEAKFSIFVNILTSGVIGVVFAAIIVGAKAQFPLLFTSDPEVTRKTSKLGYVLAATIFLNSIQIVSNGVAVGAGWQFSVALVNLVCYYVIGLPMGAVLGYKLNLGVEGIWWAMLGGTFIQTVALFIIFIRTNWEKAALAAEERVRNWGGADNTSTETPPQESS